MFPRSIVVLGASVLLAVSGQQSIAQTTVLRGVVNDSAGKPIPEADVGIVALHRLVKTDAKGRFSMDSVPAGRVVEVSVRRLGYKPQTLKLTISQELSYSYEITLDGNPALLDGMDVTEKRRRIGIEEFYERRTKGLGTFFTRADLLDRNASTPSDIVRSTPGIKFVRAATGSGIRFVTPSNARSRDCVPMLWVDGQAAPGMELDDIPVSDVEGIELYQSLSSTPGQFWRGNTTPCGVIVVWTRNPGGA